MYYIILFLPLLSAITTLLTGRYIGSKGAGILTTSSIMITSILSWIALYEIGFNGSPVYVHL
jgi:NADH:ubiquinone oxidoreductase subunit 5 (subunit L)/multisubunit Na+/H+ antiporter MnhA subunit